MRRLQSFLATVLITLVVTVLFVILTPGSPTLAQEMPPRPVPPVPAATATPVEEDESNQSRPTSQPRGTITGTVFDIESGAPLAGVQVYVGGTLVLSDEHGNYVHSGLRTGKYPVLAGSSPGKFLVIEPLQFVKVYAGSTVVLHLHVSTAHK